jgi:hypothetical protein
VANWRGRWFAELRQLRVLVMIVASAGVLGISSTAAHAASEPVVHVYDVQVTGTLRPKLSLPSKPLRLDFGYSQTSKWTETYKGVRLEVQTLEYVEPTMAMRMSGKGKGTVTGSIKYGLFGPHIKSCGLSSNRPEPGSLNLVGSPYSSSGAGSVTYKLVLITGRSATTPALRSSKCSFFEGNWAKFTGAPVGPDGGMATGYIDTRMLRFTVEFRTPQQTGQLGFPLNQLHAGAGFVLNLKGKTKDGRKTSEGTARITFVPRPS